MPSLKLAFHLLALLRTPSRSKLERHENPHLLMGTAQLEESGRFLIGNNDPSHRRQETHGARHYDRQSELKTSKLPLTRVVLRRGELDGLGCPLHCKCCQSKRKTKKSMQMLPSYQHSPLFPSDYTSEAHEMTSTRHRGTQNFYGVDLPRHCLYKAGNPRPLSIRVDHLSGVVGWDHS